MQFSHIAGDPILDVINTVEWRLGGPDREEDLTTYGHVLGWCTEAGLLDEAEVDELRAQARREPGAAESERLAVIALREAFYEALFEQGAGDLLAQAHREALADADLVHDQHVWRWADRTLALRTPRHRLARGIVGVLARDDLDRLHQCEDERCGWVYLDTSPRRNRRWCVTKDCGDRNRSRAYYARQKAKTR